MIIVGDQIVSDDIAEVCFACDLEKCMGACCVDGDAGAPLEEEEISILEDEMDYFRAYLSETGRGEIEKHGVFGYDQYGELVTPLVNGRECAFANFNSDDIAYCAIEKAYEDGKTKARKPLSCHLYPVRISRNKGFDAVNYHRWHICEDAIIKGTNNKIPLYTFLKDALTRKYGRKWYNKLITAIKK